MLVVVPVQFFLLPLVFSFFLSSFSCFPRSVVMVSNVGELIVAEDSKDSMETIKVLEVSPSPVQTSSRPTSMVIKKAHTVIPAHLVAEAMSTLRGLDLRWSGPITPTEMDYVKQYVLAKYPQYSNGIVEYHHPEPKTEPPPKPTTTSPSTFTRSFSDLDRTQLSQSRLLDILTKKTSFQGNFMSIPEIQGRNRALKQCGLSEKDYLVIFMPSYKDALSMVGESYPFCKGSYYMSVVGEDVDGGVRVMATGKEAKVVPMPESWLDLRIKGSQLSQYFRRKCKSVPKGLFAYPAELNGTRYSMHWISEAHRNSWHVLLDATGLVFGEERVNLALHRPDFVLCGLENNGGSGHGFVDNGGQQMVSNIACLLVRKDSFDTSSPSNIGLE